MGKQKVKLTYFKKNGTYYSDAEYETDSAFSLNTIWVQVRDMREDGFLPGLSRTDAEFGHTEFLVLVEVPEHQYEHPKIVGL